MKFSHILVLLLSGLSIAAFPGVGGLRNNLSKTGPTNHFAGDPNCVAVWRMESGALTFDAVGANTLTNYGVTADTADFREGAASADFELSNSTYLLITDADLSADFPLKYGGSYTDISICLWFKFESFTTNQLLISKYGLDDQRTFSIRADGAEGKDIAVHLGHSSGTDRDIYYSEAAMTTGRWYHIGLTYAAATQALYYEVYDATAGAVIATVDVTATNPMSILAANFCIGSRTDGATFFDGLIDEVVVFNDILTPAQIGQIRSGTYP